MKKKSSDIAKIIRSKIIDKDRTRKSISYTQLSSFVKCPHQWFLTYKMKLYPFSSSIHTVFGTAIHNSLQEYLTVLFNSTAKAADALLTEEYFRDKLIDSYKIELTRNSGIHFSTPGELKEFNEDGWSILKWIKRKRKILFDVKYIELIGIEIPIFYPIDNTVVYFDGKIDLVFYDHLNNKILIYDIKTSGRGWKDKEKKDPLKLMQILLYKKFFSQQFDFDIEKIDLIFFIVKRKIFEGSEFPQPRVTIFRPPAGSVSMNKATKALNRFLIECFDEKGDFIESSYSKRPSADNCVFCPYREDDEKCDKNIH